MLQIRTTNAFLKGMLGILAVCTIALGPLAMFNLYFMPYWINVVWLDIVTYLHHHGPEDETEKVPWYRGEVCSPLELVNLPYLVSSGHEMMWLHLHEALHK